jgi:hypothetical protein
MRFKPMADVIWKEMGHSTQQGETRKSEYQARSPRQ